VALKPLGQHFSYNDNDTENFFSKQILRDSAILTENTWEHRALGIPNPAEGACAIQLSPVQFILIGGYTPSEPGSGFRTFIINKDTTSQPGPDLLTPRIAHSCAKLESSSPIERPRVIAIGGLNPQEMLSTTESLNEETMQWEDGRQISTTLDLVGHKTRCYFFG